MFFSNNIFLVVIIKKYCINVGNDYFRLIKYILNVIVKIKVNTYELINFIDSNIISFFDKYRIIIDNYSWERLL